MTTDLDTAHAAMQAAPDDDTARLRFYERVADAELFMLLSGDDDDDTVTPELFDIKDQQYVLVFDTEERLSDFVGRPVPYAGVPGRALIGMLAGQGAGLALNLDVAPSAMLIPDTAVDWLAQTLTHSPDETEGRLQELRAPKGLPDDVLEALARKLGITAGLATDAYLAAATYEGGAIGHVLAFVGAQDTAHQALAHAAGEALTFSGVEAGTLDVIFVDAADPVTERLAKVGLHFDLAVEVPDRPTPAAPGSDPAKPPILR